MAGVDNLEENFVQPVCTKFKEINPWIESAHVSIHFPEKCDATWTYGFFETRNRPKPGGHVQYNWIAPVKLKTTKTYELCNAAEAAADFLAASGLYR